MRPLHSMIVLLPIITLLSACVSTTVPSPSCCYQGEVTLTRLHQVIYETGDGKTLTLAQVLPGFQPQEGLFTSPLPFREAKSEDIIYASLEPLLPLYDSNSDGRLEHPEIITLYLREAIRGLGNDVKRMGNPAPISTLIIPPADVGGLVNYVQAHLSQMSPEAQLIFSDLSLLGLDLLSPGNQGGGEDQGNDFL